MAVQAETYSSTYYMTENIEYNRRSIYYFNIPRHLHCNFNGRNLRRSSRRRPEACFPTARTYSLQDLLLVILIYLAL
jgi:hypothetical protein